jgi:oligoribonuclease NrnB/cAMP/cGMP phosphodiesterase (DHH superfamily)
MTDLNFKEVSYAEKLEKRLEEVGASIQVIDHHDSGVEVAEAKSWYKLDNKNCATRLVYEYCQKWNPELDYSSIEDFVMHIDNYDLYKEPYSTNFLKGELYQQLTFSTNKLFPRDSEKDSEVQRLKREFILFGIEQISAILKDGSIKDVELINIEKLLFEHIVKKEHIENMEDIRDNKNINYGDKLILLFEQISNYSYPEVFLKKITDKMGYSDEQISESLLKKYKTECYKKFGGLKEEYQDILIQLENKLLDFKNSSTDEIELQFKKLLQAKKDEYKLDVTLTEKEVIKEEIIPIIMELIRKKAQVGNLENIFTGPPENLDFIIQEELENYKKSTGTDIEHRKIFRAKEVLSNSDMPTTMSISMFLNERVFEKETKQNLYINDVDTKVKIIFDLDTNFFQHSSYEFTFFNQDTVVMKMSSNRGNAGVRSKNGKSKPIAEKFGGGGHPDAGGFHIKLDTIMPKELLEKAYDRTISLTDKIAIKKEIEINILQYLETELRREDSKKEAEQNSKRTSSSTSTIK